MASAISISRFLAPIPTPPSTSLRRPSIPRIHLLPVPFALRQKFPLLRRRFSTQENNGGAAEAIAGKEEENEAKEEKSAAVAAELREMMAKRKDRSKAEEFAEGLSEEVREIEWPEFGKVVGTTGVVLAVIAGSSVALLTVNAILAEFSDRVFGGKGVQDFFTGY